MPLVYGRYTMGAATVAELHYMHIFSTLAHRRAGRRQLYLERTLPSIQMVVSRLFDVSIEHRRFDLLLSFFDRRFVVFFPPSLFGFGRSRNEDLDGVPPSALVPPTLPLLWTSFDDAGDMLPCDWPTNTRYTQIWNGL